jgi:hypothetical protein
LKKIRLTVEFDMELKVPDHVKLVKLEDIGEFLFVHGKLLEPQLAWEALSRIGDDESYEFEKISDQLAHELFDMIRIVNKSDMKVSTIDSITPKRKNP